ncbi:hypothetical protein [Streptomyces sp. NPDC055400]
MAEPVPGRRAVADDAGGDRDAAGGRRRCVVVFEAFDQPTRGLTADLVGVVGDENQWQTEDVGQVEVVDTAAAP